VTPNIITISEHVITIENARQHQGANVRAMAPCGGIH
jgi:hypothetical protein